MKSSLWEWIFIKHKKWRSVNGICWVHNFYPSSKVRLVPPFIIVKWSCLSFKAAVSWIYMIQLLERPLHTHWCCFLTTLCNTITPKKKTEIKISINEYNYSYILMNNQIWWAQLVFDLQSKVEIKASKFQFKENVFRLHMLYISLKDLFFCSVDTSFCYVEYESAVSLKTI